MMTTSIKIFEYIFPVLTLNKDKIQEKKLLIYSPSGCPNKEDIVCLLKKIDSINAKIARNLGNPYEPEWEGCLQAIDSLIEDFPRIQPLDLINCTSSCCQTPLGPYKLKIRRTEVFDLEGVLSIDLDEGKTNEDV